jgi:hypothetical protein
MTDSTWNMEAKCKAPRSTDTHTHHMQKIEKMHENVFELR